MSLLSTKLGLLARFPSFIHTLRMNATTTTTSDKQKKVPVPVRSNYKLLQIGFVVVGVCGLLAMLRASRKEEQLIKQSIDRQHDPPVAIPPK